MSTTVSGKSCCFKMSLIMSTRLDLIGEAPRQTGAVPCWARTGKEGGHTLDQSRPMIWRGHRPPKLCHPGRVKCKENSLSKVS